LPGINAGSQKSRDYFLKLPKKSKPTTAKEKLFVLDTNVLLHDPQCLYKFEENTLAIPVEVLEELDRKKASPGELGFSARSVHRDLRTLFDRGEAAVPEALEGRAARCWDGNFQRAGSSLW
jgi:PhoH-like ATPase